MKVERFEDRKVRKQEDWGWYCRKVGSYIVRELERYKIRKVEQKKSRKQSFEMSNILRGQDFSWIFLRKKRVIHDKTKSRQNSVNHVSWRYMVKENAPFQIILQSCLFTDQKLAQLQKNLHLLHILLQSCALSSQNFARIIKNCTFSRFFSKAARSMPKILRG